MKSPEISSISLLLLLPLYFVQLFVSSAVYSNEINSTQHRARANNVARSVSLPFTVNPDGNVVIPGLYESFGGIITPIQGHKQFRKLVLGLDDGHSDHENNQASSNSERRQQQQQQVSNDIKQAAKNQTISLVQFYMATCPDCQGFSAYFKRFARSIEPHWRQLVRIYTVNCNDFLNIHLCQEENPKLIVPMVRWYVMPIIQSDSHTHKFRFNYSRNLLNIAHRQFIEKQRRDLISLRRATIRFINLMMDELSRHKMARNSNQTNKSADELLLDALPLRWHLMEQLGSRVAQRRALVASSTATSNAEQFISDLEARLTQCTRGEEFETPVRNFIVFEARRSFAGRTLAADWSNVTCSGQPPTMIHHTSDLSLLNQLKLINNTSHTVNLNSTLPILLAFNATARSPIEHLDELKFRLLARNSTMQMITNNSDQLLHRAKRHGPQGHYQRPERLQQRASLQKFYARSQPSFRYASSMMSAGRRRRKRFATNETAVSLAKLKAQAEADNINWAPEMLYPNEERLRYEFNQRVAHELNLDQSWWPSSLQANPGEIFNPKVNGSRIIQAKEDDLTLLLLTDYYRGLDEIIHVDLFSKGELDYNQLLASSCFLKELIRYFPFQGNVHAPNHLLAHHPGHLELVTSSTPGGAVGGPTSAGGLRQVKQSAKSIARHYLQLIRVAYNAELEKQLGSANFGLMCSSLQSTLSNVIITRTSDTNTSRLNNSTTNKFLPETGANQTAKVVAERPPLVTNSSTGNKLSEFRIKTRDLEKSLADIRRKYDVGLPGAENFGWKYCVGSSNYLRGHTCALWILFHTLTVHEYLERLDERLEAAAYLSEPRSSSKPTRFARLSNSTNNSESSSTTTMATISNQTQPESNDNAGEKALVGRLLSSAYQADNVVASSSSARRLEAALSGESGNKKSLAEAQVVHRERPLDDDDDDDDDDGENVLVEYKFQIDYSRPPKRHCDPKNPDESLLNASSAELLVNETQFVLANIINFVRFYLPCTNCAAHFSCMVEHSSGLKFAGDDSEPDSHLLWLWEGHNRVNERTRGSHSEDPTRPKHIFPIYEACPSCYMEKPANNTIPFTSMRFNRRQLVKFLVARYQRSAILNNKINIEDLYKKNQ